MRFVGRQSYLRWLDEEFERVDSSGGRFLALRGRRQVGKSRLVTEWLSRRDHPHLYYQALDKPVEQELASFATAVSRSSLGSLPTVAASGAVWPSWEAALDAVADAGGGGPLGAGPGVVVIDELPYLIENDDSFEATLQAAWDHRLQHTGILLIVVGSDLSMMDAITSYGRPLYQRIDVQRQIRPLNVAEVGALLEVDPTTAFDTYLMIGGFPKVVASRAEHPDIQSFLETAMEDEAHPLVFTGQQTLMAEFPPHLSPRDILEAIGAGERSFGKIRTRAGVSQRTLAKGLRQLQHKRVISSDDPCCARDIGNRSRYTVVDPYLRFWLRFLADRIPDISRSRGDLVAADIGAAWQSYAGRAIEPLVRDAIERLLPDSRFGGARYLGSYWSRGNRVEVDLTGTTDAGGNDRIEFAGSIKWRERKPFDMTDAAELRELAPEVPGWDTTTRHVGVSRTGFTEEVDLDVALTPDDLIGAWR